MEGASVRTPSSALRVTGRPVLTVVAEPEPATPRGEVCVLLDQHRAVVWLHGAIDGALAEDLAEAGNDLVDAGLPVLIHTRAVTSCDATAVGLVARLISAGLPVQVCGPEGPLAEALQQALLATPDAASGPPRPPR